ncbi:hypothetical protein [Litoreibacter roseus]|uniref:Hpt domain-containing protein n=1 Tax=Litoreibacter roseus TaxID=2601869 RepID=A0A6N6JH42_9RHOB|nr:hypothetical protein [Litoreibacter roseus]GFE64709.1 hypothetical protein KIN_17830 [Litoreibacter roseus]
MSDIIKLKFVERVILDPDRLVELCVSLGDAGAEELISLTMEELSCGLGRVEEAYTAQNWSIMSAEARQLSNAADHIGMQTFVTVVADVVTCVEQQDFIALSATLERLRRIADKSLNAMWDMQDIPG